jgi:hypothetical protein
MKEKRTRKRFLCSSGRPCPQSGTIRHTRWTSLGKDCPYRCRIKLSYGITKSPHRKKSFSIFPSPVGMSLAKLSLGGNNGLTYKLFPPRESLVSHIPAGDGNIEMLFLQCMKQIIRRGSNGDVVVKELQTVSCDNGFWQGVTKRCRLPWLTNSDLVYAGGGGSCGVSAMSTAVYTGAQINFGDLPLYLTYRFWWWREM